MWKKGSLKKKEVPSLTNAAGGKGLFMLRGFLHSTASSLHCMRHRRFWSLNGFLDSPWFVMLLCALTVLGNALQIELVIYTLFVLFGIYICLFGWDLLPLMSVIVQCYLLPSPANNPGCNRTSIFYPENGGIYLICLIVLLAISLIYRLVTDPHFGGRRFLHCIRRLLPGIFVLGIGYMLAGAFSGRYYENGLNNLMFALLQTVSIGLPYWIFSGAVKWKRTRSDYLSWVGLGAGLTVCCELIVVYVTQHVIVNGAIVSGRIFTGWGNANNMGCIIAMMIPFAVDLSHRLKFGWIYSILGILMIAFTFLTCSRTSIGAAVLIYVVSMALAIRDPRRRTELLIANGVALALIVGSGLFHNAVEKLFSDLIQRGLDPRLRDIIYVDGLKTFLAHPIFGDTFYPNTDSIFQWATIPGFRELIPGRWHNTVIQLLASCGLVGMGCYSFHRLQTLRLFWERRRTDVTFIGLSLLAMLLMSLLDCHFFNVGPVLFYSMALSFAEKVNPAR